MQPLNSDRSSISVIAFILGMLGLAQLGDSPVQAQTVILPGESIVLNSADAPPECSGEDSGVPVTRECQTNERHLDVAAVSGISSEELLDSQTGSTLATLINQILIPESANASQVLAVDVATEVAWSGALIVGGFNNTFAQVIATLQVRNTTTGQVVASDTFLFERADAKLAILDAIDIVSGVKITNSTGTNITAFLERGQIYAIEVEAKCDIAVPSLGGSACTFFDDVASVITIIPFSSAFVGDGFDVGPITVTVASDPVEGLLGN